MNVELASPDDFIPEVPGWQERSRFIQQEGKLTFFHYDFYAQALAKIERRHTIDEEDNENLQVDLKDAVSLYGTASRIRLFASDRVIKEAEAVLDLILAQFGAENISVEQLREKKLKERDPLKEFSISCRRELKDLQRV